MATCLSPITFPKGTFKKLTQTFSVWIYGSFYTEDWTKLLSFPYPLVSCLYKSTWNSHTSCFTVLIDQTYQRVAKKMNCFASVLFCLPPPPPMCDTLRVLMIALWRSGPPMMAVYSQHSAATQLRSVTWLSTTRTHCLPQQAVTKPSECGVYAPAPPSLFCRPMRPPSHPSWWGYCMLISSHM